MKSVKSILWAQGISGDLPMILVMIKNYEDINIIYDVLKAHEYWRAKGISADLVIISKEGIRYDHPLWNSIYEIVCMSHLKNSQNVSGGIYLLRGEILQEYEYEAFRKSASLVFEKSIFEKQDKGKNFNAKVMNITKGKVDYDDKLETTNLEFFNGIGGFDEKNNEYVIHPSIDNYTPSPWINIIANKDFGSILTESGGGFTWLYNSREFRITPWSNDAVEDKRGEIIYIRDDTTGEIFNPYILPCEKNGKYEVRYGLGYVKYISAVCGIKAELTVFIPKNDKVKVSILKIKNSNERSREFSFFYYIDPVLSFTNNLKERYMNLSYEDNKIVFSNEYEKEFADNKIFMKILGDVESYSFDKEAFFGTGKEKEPDIFKYENLGNSTEYILPIGSLQVKETIAPGEEKELVFLLGEDNNETIKKYNNVKNCVEGLNEVRGYFKDEVMKIKVKTPDKAVNLLLNGFLLYQALVCRIWSRSAFYQSGGAFGFRDQLQDSIPLSYTQPSITREQIILHASHQFEEGDVLHWWHEEGSKGTRTRFSDDLLWLPYVVFEYISVTGDDKILDEEASFIRGDLLNDFEDEKYLEFYRSEKKADIFTHLVLAIERVYKLGEHGLILMGSGDWNDGMNTVGNKGKGESVWLSMFMYKILTSFSSICKSRGKHDDADKYAEMASLLSKNIDENAWDGDWYKRAFFDDGTPLGSIQNEECKIDSIPESWSIISEVGEIEKCKKAMSSVENYLIDKENGLIKLLTPAFDKSDLNPGYIKSYPSGIRENGGQYTHAAVWVGIAYAIIKDYENANKVFDMLNPINHSRTDIEMKKYKLEPYVIAADIYTNTMHIGRGGWSWYTGAAAWMYKFGIEYILGFKKRGNKIILNPAIRKSWDEYEIEYRYNQTVYKIKVMNMIKESTSRLIVDGVLSNGNSFEMLDDGGIHFIELTI